MSDYVGNEIDEAEGGKSNSVAWFITGAAIGVTIAMLYAPKAGKDTRQTIADTTQKGKEAVAETGTNIVEASRDMFERGRKLVEDAAELFERGRKLMRG
jgi:gas vesicle protein